MNREKRFYKRSIVAILFFLSALMVPVGRVMAAVDNNPLCFTAKGGSVTVQFDVKTEDYTIQYKKNNGQWTKYTKDTDDDGDDDLNEYPTITINAGDKVYFRATSYPTTLVAYGADVSDSSSHFIFTREDGTSGTVEASGNIMSLFNKDCDSWVLPENAFAYMFENCTLLTKAPQLPAADLKDDVDDPSENCYAYMFAGCTALTTAPELPATTLAPYCYYHTFDGCTSLVTPPELPARDLKNYCYQCMFQNCTSLTSVPVLPSTILDEGCYMRMFNGCTALRINSTGSGKAWSINATSANNALDSMFYGTGGTLTRAPVIGTTYYIASGATKSTSSNATYWDVASSWGTGGIPGDADDVTVSHSITIPDGVNAHCNSIIINDNCTLTVAPTATLHAVTITSDAASKLLIKSDANGTGTVRFANTSVANPKATVEMCMKGSYTEEDKPDGNKELIPDWQYRGFIGNPDASQELSNIVIFKWDETKNDDNIWGGTTPYYNGYADEPPSGNFDDWIGYSMANFDSQYAVRTYTTTLQSTSISHKYDLTRTESGNGSTSAENCGVNLITNSYSAPINLCNSGIGFDKDSVQNTYYFFNTRSNSAFHNDTASAITTYPGVVGSYLRTHNPYIPAGQSFAVKARINGATLRIPASAVSTINSGEMYAPRKEEEDARFSGLVKIVVESDDGIDDLYLLQVENCSAEFDNGYDGTKLFSSKAHQIYATNDYGKTAVNSDRTLLGQYIGFKPLTSGTTEVTMTISTRDLEGYEELYLYDRVADSYTEITEDEVTYTFDVTGEENERRFQIVGKASDGTEYRPKAEPRIEVAGGEIWLMNFERTDARIIVTDATGKTLWSVNATEGTKFTLPQLPKGVYIVSCGKVSTKYVQ